MPSSTSAHFDIPGAHTHYDNRVDADVFRVYVTWDDWQYYSTQVWKVSTIFVVFVSDAGSYQATTDYMRNKYMDSYQLQFGRMEKVDAVDILSRIVTCCI